MFDKEHQYLRNSGNIQLVVMRQNEQKCVSKKNFFNAMINNSKTFHSILSTQSMRI
ncbi:hypothetical protein SAMN05443529_14215 [Desulfosporosinus hippei DSM 8344]|uniref:Uncharacterized protein n=1 Tax=Desulfosporosinus hippei DSM 8344 TaxID=1121419 RepID=A0A1G8KX35_9FIRM|nr:hypothetical protein SAMN05443529_14215 [Desulfosporosinus hippei DSM 8344]